MKIKICLPLNTSSIYNKMLKIHILGTRELGPWRGVRGKSYLGTQSLAAAAGRGRKVRFCNAANEFAPLIPTFFFEYPKNEQKIQQKKILAHFVDLFSLLLTTL